eukprot:GHVT01033015.1.p1 GENE.GHVT01033015.1~~GHVT01033015.1.p1  ORF type:complete len:268 (+),score=-0.46 GHVT01033015.1:3152-3955(+)
MMFHPWGRTVCLTLTIIVLETVLIDVRCDTLSRAEQPQGEIPVVQVPPATGEAWWRSRAVELSNADLHRHIRHWEHDVAIVFYARWDAASRHLLSIWDQISTSWNTCRREKAAVMVAKFDCVRTTSRRALCRRLGVDEFPTVLFFGFGQYRNMSPRLFPFLRGNNVSNDPLDRITKYPGDPFLPEQLRDWIRAMHWISRSYKYRHWFRNFTRRFWAPRTVIEKCPNCEGRMRRELEACPEGGHQRLIKLEPPYDTIDSTENEHPPAP